MSETATGGCYCGAVRFRINAAPQGVAVCHCASCRRATGAAFAVYVDCARAELTVTSGAFAYVEKVAGVRRGFCAACGTSLSYEGANLPDMIHLHLGAFDAPERFTPSEEVAGEERLAWVHPL